MLRESIFKVLRFKHVLLLFAVSGRLFAADQGAPALSIESKVDVPLTADPDSEFWKSIPGVLANHDNMAVPVKKDTTEIRLRWTGRNLYVLFICNFESLNLKPRPDTRHETFGLWNWDVAEMFIGDDFKNINLYKEFEVSPQGEWIDLDIDSNHMSDSSGASRWESGFKVKARIDQSKKVWYGEMCIPFQAISGEPAKVGMRFRANFYRAAGQEPNRLLRTWRPTFAPNFHVPASFGILQLSTTPTIR